MPKQFELKCTGESRRPSEGFWAAVDVWIQKPHVVNKRLCGVKLSETKETHRDELRFVLGDGCDSELTQDVLDFLSAAPSSSQTLREPKPLCSTVRTFIPKVNSDGTVAHRELVFKDFDQQKATFIPFEEHNGGRVSVKKGNIYLIQLLLQESEEWVLELHVLSPDDWFSDNVVYPKLRWLSSDLLPKLMRWTTESKKSEFTSTLSLLPVEKYSITYQHLKEKYKTMVQVWPEVTDPEKFVYEDVAIATYLLVLWSEERSEKDLTSRQTFVDLGCGNGLLVHILTNEGHPGKGIDLRKRKIWSMYGPHTLLEEKAITPSESSLFPDTDWLIGNHSDELTPWIPVMAARSSYDCRYFLLPCCFFDFFCKFQRRQCKKTQYRLYIDFISEVSQACGFNTQEDCLRIPSTKRVCLVGKSRNYQKPDEAEADRRRSAFIHSRQPSTGQRVQGSDVEIDCCHGSTLSGTNGGISWGAGFQPRERVEVVRNCSALPRDFVDAIVLRVANVLLEMTAEDGWESSTHWNPGGSLSLGEVAALMEQETLQRLKRECGGLQTLLKNNHHVFRVEKGRVHIRDWRDVKSCQANTKKKAPPAGTRKTRSCWFHCNHPQGCPLQAQLCAFAHGAGDLRPSTKPLKTKM
ncbi:putative tRNA (uracil-O(2)-)-methyltransferase [Synchiropus picturatus]